MEEWAIGGVARTKNNPISAAARGVFGENCCFFLNNYLEHTNLVYLNNDLLLYTGNIERKYEEAKLMKQKIK